MPENDQQQPEKRFKPVQVLRWCLYLIAGFVFLSVTSVVLLRWINPPSSSVMFQHKIALWWSGQDTSGIQYQWEDWNDISDFVKMAAITSEDQRFPYHRGFDFEAIREAFDENRRGEPLRGASTITQQVAKNLFLWSGRSFIRKGFEAWYTVLIELLWPKTRILEVYLNIAQFGADIYGVEAASNRFFSVSASELDIVQSALLVTALPSPARYNVGAPSPYMIERRNWVLRYMLLLGHNSYLERLE